jgi:hypothetical protein
MARRKQAASAAAQLTPETPTPQQLPEAVPPQSPEPLHLTPQQPDAQRSQRPHPAVSDPREWKSVKLGPDRDSPRLRLLRSDRFNQMQIRSDEELPPPVREKLANAGWTERPQEGIWTRQLPSRRQVNGEEPAPPWPTVVEAERFLQDIANEVRTGKGLPPVTSEQSR